MNLSDDVRDWNLGEDGLWDDGWPVVDENEYDKAPIGVAIPCAGCQTVFTPTRQEVFPYTVRDDEENGKTVVELWAPVCSKCQAEHEGDEQWWGEL